MEKRERVTDNSMKLFGVFLKKGELSFYRESL